LAKTLIDTSVWIDFFRKKEPCYALVSQLLDEQTICTAGLIMAELIQGVKTHKEVDIIKDFVSTFEYLQDTPHIWLNAAEAAYKLRRTGTTASLSDCLIASLALHYDAELLSLDSDFTAIRAIAPFKHSLCDS
jgi:predicted nucleic acid-binding protein